MDLFAPARCYGTPDDLRRLVDEAHRLGLAVLLDVVYNHFGPDGNYLARFSADYFSARHKTPWGPAINLDGPACAMVRAFFIENALHWLHEYHIDGLRLDATHRLFDESPRHFLAELAATVRESIAGPGRPPDRRGPRATWRRCSAPSRRGAGASTALWSDDFHHELRRYLAGDFEGVFRDFRGHRGRTWSGRSTGAGCSRGEYSIHRGYYRGTDPTGLRARGLRLLHPEPRSDRQPGAGRAAEPPGRSPATYRAASALLLWHGGHPAALHGPGMGGDSSPFLFFTDHHEELGRLVQAGRRHEFRRLRGIRRSGPAATRSPTSRPSRPSSPASSTGRNGTASRMRSTLRLYQALLAAPPHRARACGLAAAGASRPSPWTPTRWPCAAMRNRPVALARRPAQGTRHGLARRPSRRPRPPLGAGPDDRRRTVLPRRIAAGRRPRRARPDRPVRRPGAVLLRAHANSGAS